MAKPERGLPKSFDIKVPDAPVRLGDYLDEAPAPARPLIPAVAAPAPSAPVPPPPPVLSPAPAPAPSPQAISYVTPATPPAVTVARRTAPPGYPWR